MVIDALLGNNQHILNTRSCELSDIGFEVVLDEKKHILNDACVCYIQRHFEVVLDDEQHILNSDFVLTDVSVRSPRILVILLK